MATPEELRQRGAELVGSKQWGEARAVWGELLALLPSDTEALFAYGRCCLSTEAYPEALDAFDRYLRQKTDVPAAFYNRGYAKYWLDKYDEAIGDFDAYLAADADDADTHYYRAECLRLTNRAAQAAENYDRAVALAPRDPKVWFGRAYNNERLERWHAAEEDLTRYIQLRPENMRARSERAVCRMRLGDHRGAIDDYDRCLFEKPDDAELLQYRGLRRLDSGDFRRAIEDHQRAIQLDEGRREACGPFIEYAERLLRLAASGPPSELAAALCERGWIKQEEKAPLIAQQWFARAIDAHPEHADAWYGRGMACIELGRHAEALYYFDHALEHDRSRAVIFRERGRARRITLDIEGALLDYEDALALEPGDRWVHSWRATARCLKDPPDYAGAVADYDMVLGDDWNVASDWYNRGWAHRRLGNNKEAVRDYSRAAELDPKDVDTFVGRGYAYRDLGENARAIEDLRRAIALGATNRSDLEETIQQLTAIVNAARARN
jgi:tetratricopeptide (TPR) repeat protein